RPLPGVTPPEVTSTPCGVLARPIPYAVGCSILGRLERQPRALAYERGGSMTLGQSRRALRALLALPLIASPASALASGFAIESEGARGMAFAGASVAQPSAPSPIFYNAAGIGFLKGKQLYISGSFASLSTDFTGTGPVPPAGTLEHSSNGLALLPAFYYSQRVNDRIVVGLGVTRPFATKSQWDNPNDFTGRYICIECSIDSWSINPTVAIKLADRFAIGGGLDRRFSNFQLSRRPIPD